MKKFLRNTILIAGCVLIAGGGTGGIYWYRTAKAKKATVKVYSVSTMKDMYWGDEISAQGTVQSANVQKVLLDNQLIVEKVLVKEGDSVTIGTPLLQYDTTAAKLNVAQKQNAVAIAEDHIRTANKELNTLQNLRPSEDAPIDDGGWEPDDPGLDDSDEISDSESEEPIVTTAPPDTPILPNQPDASKCTDTIHAVAEAVSREGRAAKPYWFACKKETVATTAFLQELQKAGACAELFVFDGTTCQYIWSITSTSFTGKTLSDWVVGKGITIDTDGSILVDPTGTYYGNLKLPAMAAGQQTDAEDSHTDSSDVIDASASEEDASAWDTEGLTDTEEVDPDFSDYTYSGSTSLYSDYMYSSAELQKMIRDKQNELKKLEIDKKQAELDLKDAQQKQQTGQELSKIDGVVTKLAADPEALEATDPLMIIQGEGGVSIQGQISEMNLTKLAVGDVLSVTSWETGDVVEATVTKIETTPVTGEDVLSYGENPNNSMYPFLASVQDSVSWNVGDPVSISISSTEESDSFYLPVQYVRQEDGQYYVMKKDAHNKLKKQMVQTGKLIYGGYEIEIKGGLTEDDWICFPYGKTVKEGTATQDSDQSY